MEKICCPHCKNHCFKDALLCDQGREEFGLPLLKKRKRIPLAPENPLSPLLQCGHLLHHGLLEQAETIDLTEALAPQEKTELHRLLTCLYTDWQKLL